MASHPVRVLSLCSGYGGLDKAVGVSIPSARTICYVEREVTAAAVLAARMADGSLDAAPVWSDLTNFPAEKFRGVVDLVVAGFPCQPVSVAGKGLGADDPRWLWPHVLRVIRETEASACFLENVPGLVNKGLQPVLEGLASLGFDAEWGCLDAGAVGASHLRDRWFCLAYSRRQRPWWTKQVGELGRSGETESQSQGAAVANSDSGRCEVVRGCGVLDGERAALGNDTDGRHSWPPIPGDTEGWAGWAGPQPAVRRGTDGTSGRLHRLRMLGNGVVWQQAARAFQILAERIVE